MSGRRVEDVAGKQDILRKAKVLAVLGLGRNPGRPAYGVARYLQQRGWRILPVHPAGGEVLGERIHRSLAELPVRPDVVDVFRNPVHLPGIVRDVLAMPEDLKPWAIWFQDGVVDEQTANDAAASGLLVVMDDCTARVAGRMD
ncbi:MAG: CoA-binding protein [Myxococcota bacterium]